MKKFLTVVFVFLLSLFTALGAAACGENGSGNLGGNSGGNQGGGSQPIAPPEVFYDEAGELTFKDIGGFSVVVEINGKQYSVFGSVFSVKDKITQSGEYPFTVRISDKDGEVLSQSFVYILEYSGGNGGGEDKQEQVTVSFYAADESLIKRIFVAKGYALQEGDYPALPTAAGVTYAWSVSPTAVTENLDISIQATYQEYAIAYQTNGGVLEEGAPESYTVREQVALPTPTREGYLFGGWFTNASCTGKALTFVGGEGNTGSVTVYAKWSEITPEARELLDALDASAKKKAVTSVADGYESAVDLSGATPYRHAKSGGKISFVVTGGNYYDYQEKSYYAYEEKVSIFYALPFEGIYGNIAEIVPEQGGGATKSFLIRLKGDGEAELRIKVEGGLVTYIGTKDGKQYYDISYSVTKITPDSSQFEKKKKIVIEVYYDDTLDRTVEYFVAEDKKLTDFPEVQEILSMVQNAYAKGFFLDRECTKPVTNTSQVTSLVYFVYYSHTYLIENTPVTLRHTCGCADCNGKTTDYEVTFKEWLEARMNFKVSPALLTEHKDLILHGFTSRVFDGYCLEGPFSERAIDKEHPEGENPFDYNEALTAYERAVTSGNPYGFVFEIFTRKRAMRTETLTVHMGSEVLTYYISAENGVSIHDGFIYDYLPEGQIYYGWYADEAMEEPLEHNLGETSLREFYAKVGEDTRKEITVHLGVKKGAMELTDRYYSQGQEYTGRDEEFGPTQKLKFFEHISLLKVLQTASITHLNESSMDGKMVAGFYMDEDFTKPITEQTQLSEVTDIYVKWGREVSFTLHYFYGETQEGIAIEGELIKNLVEDWRMHSVVDGCRSTYKFYADEKRTKEIVGLIAGDIFVGYEPLPMITLVCEEGCTAETHSARATASYLEEGWFYEGNLLGLHGFYIGNTQEFNTYEIYFDKEYTQPVRGCDRYYLESDLILYAKPEKPLRKATLHCGCLTHGDGGVPVSFYTETQLWEIVDETCNFGKYLPYKAFFEDAERKTMFDCNREGSGKDGVWLQKLTKVTVQIFGKEGYSILVEDLRQALYFYEEKEEWNGGEDTEMKTVVPYGLYEDDTYSKVRILPIDYKVTENEVFYFKVLTEGEYTVALKNAEYGEKTLTGWCGQLHDSQTSVDKRAYSESGMIVKAYYYDEALTDLAMEAGKNYYLNQAVTLYAELGEMPKMIIHYEHYGYPDEQGTTYDLADDESYETILWRQFGFGDNAPFEEGYMFELCENADGSGVVDLRKTATEGEYYFKKNEYAKNNIKVTMYGVKNESAIKRSWQQVGQGNYFYLAKGSGVLGLYEVLFNAWSAGVELPNGQCFRLQPFIEGGDGVYEKDEKLKIYTDQAMKQELSLSASFTGDTALYFTLDTSKLNEHTVYFTGGKFVFYTNGDPAMDGTHELISYLGSSHSEWVNESMLNQYPDLFAYGAVVETYLDNALTERYFGEMNVPKALYALTKEFYKAKVYLESGDLFASYAAFEKKSLNDIRPEFATNPKSYGVFKAGHIPYLAADKEGKTEVAYSEGLNGKYYICFKRDTSQAEITVGGYACECDSDHSYDFWDWSDKDNAAEGGEGTLLGSMQKFYLVKGKSLQTFIDAVRENHAVWRNDGDGSGDYIVYPKVTLYADKEMKTEITDLTVSGDRTVFVSVVFE